jgi:hypothetical protein
MYYFGDQIKKNGIDGACSAYRGAKSCIESFGGETPVKETF